MIHESKIALLIIYYGLVKGFPQEQRENKSGLGELPWKKDKFSDRGTGPKEAFGLGQGFD